MLLFPKSRRLIKKQDFLRVSKNYSSKFKGRFIVVKMKKNKIGSARLGIVVSKKFGKAHERNRFKRIVREAFRKKCSELLPVDLIVYPRGFAKKALSSDIYKELYNPNCV